MDLRNSPPTYQQISHIRSHEEKLRDLVLKYEIGSKFAAKLKSLEEFKTVFVFDDSGSMHYKLNESPLNTSNVKVTRWDELKYFAEICIEVANVFDDSGVDVYFLNRPTARNIRMPEQLEPHMTNPPRGFTPITQAIVNVLLDYNPNVLGDKKLLVVIVTDGEPTDETGEIDIEGFRKCIESRPPYLYTSIVMCADQEETISYLNMLDKAVPRLDVIDDYVKEKTEVLAAKGSDFRFSFGDYVVKSLLGSIDSELDKLDEVKV